MVHLGPSKAGAEQKLNKSTARERRPLCAKSWEPVFETAMFTYWDTALPPVSI